LAHKELKDLMVSRHLSQLKLAYACKISPSALNMALNGKMTFFPAWRKRISEFLEVSEDKIFPEFSKKEVH